MREVCEALICGGSSGNNMEDSSSGGGGELRRLNVVYFLSHDGRLEHPHLIRVHHFRGSGVRLHDVKRWIADLRGEEMPNSYAWSYKRRYKTGHVWQDLMDDDLITPISDNEYVLKGSLIRGLRRPCPLEDKSFEKENKEKTTTEETKTLIIKPLPTPTPLLSIGLSPQSSSPTSGFKVDTSQGEERKEGEEPLLRKSSSRKKFLRNIFSCLKVDMVDFVRKHKHLSQWDNGNRQPGNSNNPRQCEKSYICLTVKGHMKSHSIHKLPQRTESQAELFSREAAASFFVIH